MKDSLVGEISQIIDQLEEQECIVTTGGRRAVLCVTELSYPILKGSATFSIKKTRKVNQRTDDVPYETQKLFDLLRVVRSTYAKKKGVPTYVIFSNKTLLEMCRIKPIIDRIFLSVPGIGYHKMELYGEPFMRVIRKFIAEGGK